MTTVQMRVNEEARNTGNNGTGGHHERARSTFPTSSTFKSFCFTLDLTSSILLIAFLSWACRRVVN